MKKHHALMICESMQKKQIYTVPLNHTKNGEEQFSRNREDRSRTTSM